MERRTLLELPDRDGNTDHHLKWKHIDQSSMGEYLVLLIVYTSCTLNLITDVSLGGFFRRGHWFAVLHEKLSKGELKVLNFGFPLLRMKIHGKQISIWSLIQNNYFAASPGHFLAWIKINSALEWMDLAHQSLTFQLLTPDFGGRELVKFLLFACLEFFLGGGCIYEGERGRQVWKLFVK